MPSRPTCSTCAHWGGGPATYMAPCALWPTRRTAHDETCTEHRRPRDHAAERGAWDEALRRGRVSDGR